MITPSEILEKANRIYPRAVAAWLDPLDNDPFPWRIPANLSLSEVPSKNIDSVQRVREHSKETIGFGYSVEWETRKSRKHGENDFFPRAITIDSIHDLLKLIGKFNGVFSRITNYSSISQYNRYLRFIIFYIFT